MYKNMHMHENILYLNEGTEYQIDLDHVDLGLFE